MSEAKEENKGVLILRAVISIMFFTFIQGGLLFLKNKYGPELPLWPFLLPSIYVLIEIVIGMIKEDKS